MRRLTLLFLLSASLYAQNSAVAQGQALTTTASPVLAEVIAAFSVTPVNQIQLSGTAKGYAGSSQPSGTFTATLKPTGESTLELTLGELSRTDVTGAFGNPGACSRTDAGGSTHEIAEHNCSLPIGWLTPVLALRSQSGKLNISSADAVDSNGSTRTKLTFEFQPREGTKSAIQMLAHLSHTELEIDPTSMLPVSLTFNEHPEQDAGLDFPAEIRYSDYRPTNGVQLPFHIQKYLRGGLSLDLHVETATIQ